jgi:hypothetical protein
MLLGERIGEEREQIGGEVDMCERIKCGGYETRVSMCGERVEGRR